MKLNVRKGWICFIKASNRRILFHRFKAVKEPIYLSCTSEINTPCYLGYYLDIKGNMKVKWCNRHFSIVHTNKMYMHIYIRVIKIFIFVHKYSALETNNSISISAEASGGIQLRHIFCLVLARIIRIDVGTEDVLKS